MKIKEIIAENEIIDRIRKASKQEVPLNVPGGSTVMILNDNKTPAEVVVEAIVAATGLSQSEAYRRMMQAHSGGWAAIASYASRDMAETVADKIMRHARSNTNYDHYRPYVPPRGFYDPWPLTAEVMDAQG